MTREERETATPRRTEMTELDMLTAQAGDSEQYSRYEMTKMQQISRRLHDDRPRAYVCDCDGPDEGSPPIMDVNANAMRRFPSEPKAYQTPAERGYTHAPTCNKIMAWIENWFEAEQSYDDSPRYHNPLRVWHHTEKRWASQRAAGHGLLMKSNRGA